MKMMGAIYKYWGFLTSVLESKTFYGKVYIGDEGLILSEDKMIDLASEMVYTLKNTQKYTEKFQTVLDTLILNLPEDSKI